MKLIFCPECWDVVKLSTKSTRTCECGKASGRYIDNLNAEISGTAVAVGFNNFSFAFAVRGQPERGMGKNFEAFVIPKECPTIKNLKK
jgi:hypothetical protein